jgi:molecular chaperone DnaK
MREAESHAEEDRKRKEEIETRNRADQAVYGAERMIKDTGDKLSASDKQAIEAAMEAVKKAGEGSDAAELQRTLDQLTAAQHKAAETLYKQQAPGGAAPGGDDAAGAGRTGGAPGGQSSGSRQADGDVIDAEVVDEGKP